MTLSTDKIQSKKIQHLSNPQRTSQAFWDLLAHGSHLLCRVRDRHPQLAPFSTKPSQPASAQALQLVTETDPTPSPIESWQITTEAQRCPRCPIPRPLSIGVTLT